MKQHKYFGIISRRRFLELLSLEAGALTLGGCGAVPTPRAPLETVPPAIASSRTLPAASTPAPTNAPAATPTPQPTGAANPTFLPGIRRAGETYALPRPRQSGGMPLMTALAQRRSIRSFLPDDLPVAILSDLLWAGFGVNRPESGMRTAPSARNIRDIQIYAATTGGLWRYEAEQHSLTAVLADDVRALTQPTPGSMAQAPVQLIYVSRYPAGTSEADMAPWSWAHSGFISQNVYLYCAAMDLATVVRSSVSRPPLAARMGLKDNEHITLVQTVGFRA